MYIKELDFYLIVESNYNFSFVTITANNYSFFLKMRYARVDLLEHLIYN